MKVTKSFLVRMMATKKPFKTTFFGTSHQSLQYFGLRLAKVYIKKLNNSLS